MKKLSPQEISEAFQIRSVLCWDEDGHEFVTINFPIRQIRLLEEKFGGTLVTDPGAVRELHRAFVQFMKKKGRPPDVVRVLNMPLDDFHYKRIGINTLKGHQETNLNAYIRTRRAIIAA